MTLKAAAEIIKLIETALAHGGYRVLQKQLKELRDAQEIRIEGYLSDCHDFLKAEAQRLINEFNAIAVIAKSEPESIEPESVELEQPIALTETEIYKEQLEAVVASVPVYTVVTNHDFDFRKEIGLLTTEQQLWLERKKGKEDSIVLLQASNLSCISYAGDALRLIAILGTRTLVENHILKTHISMLDLEGVLHKARKKGFDIKVSTFDMTVILEKAIVAPAESI